MLHASDPPGSALSELLDETRRQLAEAGVPLVLCPVDRVLSASPYLELLMHGRPGALVVTDGHAAEPELIRVARTGRVVIALSSPPTDPSIIQTAPAQLVAAITRSVATRSAQTARE